MVPGPVTEADIFYLRGAPQIGGRHQGSMHKKIFCSGRLNYQSGDEATVKVWTNKFGHVDSEGKNETPLIKHQYIAEILI